MMITPKFLVVGVDFSPRSRTSAEAAVALARPAGAEVELVHVVEASPSAVEARVVGLDVEIIQATLVREAESELSNLAETLCYDKLSMLVTAGRVAQQLTEHARSREADLLVVGDTGAMSTQRRRGLGTTAYRLVERGPDRVLVVKPSYHGKLDKIAAAVDFSPISDAVLDQAMIVAEIAEAELFVIHAVSTLYMRRLRRSYNESLYLEAVDALRLDSEEQLGHLVGSRQSDKVIPVPVVLPGLPGEELTTFLQDERIDMVVVGTGTSRRIVGFPIGSTTHKLVNETVASILVVRSDT